MVLEAPTKTNLGQVPRAVVLDPLSEPDELSEKHPTRARAIRHFISQYTEYSYRYQIGLAVHQDVNMTV